MMTVDMFGQSVRVGDYIAYATGSRMWVGRVTDIPRYVGDYETTIKVQINAELGNGRRRKQTFDFVADKIVCMRLNEEFK